ncbi:MAG: TldD/PmbA family protein [Candidatus Aminicenantes bacterium]|nr:TldD/PmbA family protein [Candidatus Aminicenantes bacterium]
MNFKKEWMDIAQFAVDRAKKAGAGGAAVAAEAYVNDTESIQVTVNDRAVEQMSAVNEAGIGVRVLRDGKMAFGSTNDLSKEAVGGMVDGLVKKVVYHTVDEFNVIPGKDDGALASGAAGYEDLGSYDPRVAEVPVQEKIQAALRMEAAGLGYSPKIAGSMMAVYQDGTSYVYLANSSGISGWFRQSGLGAALELTAAEGESRESGSFTKGVVKWSDFDAEDIGRKAAENAVSMLGAKAIPSAEMPLVVSPEIATQLWSFIADMLSADSVQKGRSLFAGKVGTEVASTGFSLIDDGRLKGGFSTAPIDGEGVATQTTPLIVDGVLKTYLYDSYTARKGKAKSTGNRSRGGYSSAGGVGTTNLYLKPGDAAPEAIFAGIDRGFYLTVVLGLFAAIDAASGDFSIPSAGFMIEKGKKTYPVRGVTVGGNLFELLKAVDKVGNDLTWFQSVGSPTFSVKSVKIGGSGK